MSISSRIIKKLNEASGKEYYFVPVKPFYDKYEYFKPVFDALDLNNPYHMDYDSHQSIEKKKSEMKKLPDKILIGFIDSSGNRYSPKMCLYIGYLPAYEYEGKVYCRSGSEDGSALKRVYCMTYKEFGDLKSGKCKLHNGGDYIDCDYS